MALLNKSTRRLVFLKIYDNVHKVLLFEKLAWNQSTTHTQKKVKFFKNTYTDDDLFLKRTS